mmetsp:Transcript_11206/g.34298  ORF Transcript_11206/g.34298 Transcript_11206/m.34298 type:complete len:254 (-) Transcript_11206:183-944(-)
MRVVCVSLSDWWINRYDKGDVDLVRFWQQEETRHRRIQYLEIIRFAMHLEVVRVQVHGVSSSRHNNVHLREGSEGFASECRGVGALPYLFVDFLGVLLISNPKSHLDETLIVGPGSVIDVELKRKFICRVQVDLGNFTQTDIQDVLVIGLEVQTPSLHLNIAPVPTFRRLFCLDETFPFREKSDCLHKLVDLAEIALTEALEPNGETSFQHTPQLPTSGSIPPLQAHQVGLVDLLLPRTLPSPPRKNRLIDLQ